jgi:hypothetical protein
MAGKDNAKGGSGQQVMLSAEELEKIGTQIAGLDTKIASASGSDTAARKAWVEQLINENADTVNGIADSVVKQLGDLDMPVLVGLLTRLEDRLKADLAPKVDQYVASEFPKTQTTGKEEVEGLRTQRKELLNNFKALRAVLDAFNIDSSHIQDPKRSGGGRPAGSGTGSGVGKSGANKEGYRYSIDGKPRPKSQNSFSSVAFYATDGCPAKVLESEGLTPDEAKAKASSKKWGATELKAFIAEQGVNFGEQDEFEVTLPNGKKVSARRFTEQDKIELGIDDSAPAETPVPAEAPVTAGV